MWKELWLNIIALIKELFLTPKIVAPKKEEVVEYTPPWLYKAIDELGTSEVLGPGNNKRILEYHKATSLGASEDSVPWCASFINFCLENSGVVGTNSARAQSFLQWGYPMDKPARGCIVVLKRGTNPAHGHVGFYIKEDMSGILLLSGNQNDMVCYKYYPKEDLLGYRWPR